MYHLLWKSIVLYVVFKGFMWFSQGEVIRLGSGNSTKMDQRKVETKAHWTNCAHLFSVYFPSILFSFKSPTQVWWPLLVSVTPLTRWSSKWIWDVFSLLYGMNCLGDLQLQRIKQAFAYENNPINYFVKNSNFDNVSTISHYKDCTFNCMSI